MNIALVLIILMWTLIVACFGFAIGRCFSDECHHRRSASQEFRDQITRLSHDTFMLDHRIKKALDILNEIRSR